MIKATAAIATAAFLFTSQAAFAQALVKVGHFASFSSTPEGSSVSVFVNDMEALTDVRYTALTDYIEFAAGEYKIDIVPTGTDVVAITGTFTLEDGNFYTVFAAGNGAERPLELWALLDNGDAPAEGNLNLRVVHAAPFSASDEGSEVAVTTDGGAVIIGPEFAYMDVAGWVQVPADTYNLKITNNDVSVNYLDIAPVPLPAGANVTVFAIGGDANQSLHAFADPGGVLPTTGPVDNSSNGMYEIVEGSGTGFVFQPIPGQNRLVGTWYTYDDMGNPIFFTFDSCQEAEDGSAPGVCATPGAFDGASATTALYQSTGGGPSEDDVVETVKVGIIEWIINSCNDIAATVTLDGSMDSVTYNGKQLTGAFPCEDHGQ